MGGYVAVGFHAAAAAQGAGKALVFFIALGGGIKGGVATLGIAGSTGRRTPTKNTITISHHVGRIQASLSAAGLQGCILPSWPVLW